MKHRIYRDDVVRDLSEAARWYDERRPGLGLRFLDALEETLARIEDNPLLFRILYRDFRRALLPRPFPYRCSSGFTASTWTSTPSFTWPATLKSGSGVCSEGCSATKERLVP